jgi:hypothetical protein
MRIILQNLEHSAMYKDLCMIWGISEMAILPGEWNLRESQWL